MFVRSWSSLTSFVRSVRGQRRRKRRCSYLCTRGCVILTSSACCAWCAKRAVAWMFMGTLISMHEVMPAVLGLGEGSLFARLLPHYGYFAVLIAAFWEGEAVLIAAGTLCGAGYLDWR